MPIPLPKSKYKLGYTKDEIIQYLTKAEYKKFQKNFGIQTCAIHPKTGQTLYYGWDIERAVKGLEPLD